MALTGTCIDSFVLPAMMRANRGHHMHTRAVIAAAAALLFSASALADTPPAPKPQSIAPGVWLIPGSLVPKRQPDGNTVVFDAPDGLIVMDTGRHAWHRQAILDFAKGRAKPIAAIVNSHWHLDHVSGNPALRAAYPNLKVYATNAIDAALTGFLAKSAISAQGMLKTDLPPETADDVRGDLATFENGAALKPDIVVDASGARAIAGKSIVLNVAVDAATDGDIWVYDADSGVLAAGDLVTFPAPFLDTACPVGWSKALAAIASVPFKTLIPGHGAPMTPAQFGTYRNAFDALIVCSASTRESDACAAEWTTAVQPLLGDDPAGPRRAAAYANYYVTDVLRAHGGKSAECRA